jgi:hypothetical protein
MNERIKELAEQAGIAVWGDAVYMYDPKDTLDSTVMAKFAQLLLQDVLYICEEMGDKGMDGHYCVDKIRREFGV